MDVAPAIAIAKKYTNPRAPEHAVIRFAPGIVHASTGGSGVVVQTPAVDFEGSFEAAKLLLMVKKAGDGATLSLRGTTLTITGTGGVYTLGGLTAKEVAKLPSTPDAPRRYTTLDEATFKLLVAVAGLALAGDDDPSLSAVRLAPSWAASSRGSALAVGWFVTPEGAALDIVRETTTLDARFFAGLRGPMGIGMSKAFFWLSDGADVMRWTRRLDTEVPWPDGSVSGDNLAKLRSGGTDRKSTSLDPAAALALFGRAFAAADSKADPFALLWGADLRIRGGGRLGRFDGQLAVSADGGGKTFGVAPFVWTRYLAAMSACCSGSAFLSIAGPNDPAGLWALEPRALEVFIWPEFIPPA